MVGKYALNEMGERGIITCRKCIKGEELWVGLSDTPKGKKLWTSKNPKIISESDYLSNSS
jgi:hypothetical protein